MTTGEPGSSPETEPLPFPSQPRTIKLAGLPVGSLIDRSAFWSTELEWIDAAVARIGADPSLWVPALMAHHEALRQLAIDAPNIVSQSIGPLGLGAILGGVGYPIQAEFLAWWQVYETLWRWFITPDVQPWLAAQLRQHPYEAEVLRKSTYFGAAISGIQVQSSQGSAVAPDDTKTCPFCAEVIKSKAIVCRYCGRDLPAG